jgi:hypothetical protein
VAQDQKRLYWHRRSATSIRPGDTVALDQMGDRQLTVLEGPEQLVDLVGGRVHHRFYCRSAEGEEGYMIFRRVDSVWRVWSEEEGRA